jgi:hypothetical protein
VFILFLRAKSLSHRLLYIVSQIMTERNVSLLFNCGRDNNHLNALLYKCELDNDHRLALLTVVEKGR